MSQNAGEVERSDPMLRRKEERREILAVIVILGCWIFFGGGVEFAVKIKDELWHGMITLLEQL